LDVHRKIADLGARALAGEGLDRSDLLELAHHSCRYPQEVLYWANRVRSDRFGRRVRLCSIVAGKLGGCGQDCKWCAQSVRYGGPGAATQRTGPEDILAAARQAAENRAASFGIVNSGAGPSQADLQAVLDAAQRITRDAPNGGIRLCASLGALTETQAMQLAQAGVSRYNHNLETSRRMFPEVVTTHSYDDRLRTLGAARRAGLGLCCGGLFGIGETWEDRAELALTLRDEVAPDVVPLNFLHPMPGTPLADAQPLQPAEALAIIAVFRLAMPDVDIKVAGGRESCLRQLQSWMFYAGATSCIVGNYLTTEGRCADDDLAMISDLGLTVVGELPRPAQIAGST